MQNATDTQLQVPPEPVSTLAGQPPNRRFVFDEKERVARWLAERVDQRGSWGDYYAMGIEADGELIAGVLLNHYTTYNAALHLAIDRPTKMLIELFDHVYLYAFGQLKLNRLTAFINASNEKSLRINSHVGFLTEGIMKGAAADGGDVIIRVLWPQNYRIRRSRRNVRG